MKFVLNLLSHVCIILSLMLLTLLIVDRFNPSMDFINNDVSKLILCALCVLAILLGILQLIRPRRNR